MMNRKRTLFCVLALLAVCIFACKKLNNLDTSPSGYDVDNKIFHIVASSNAIPLTVSIAQVRPNFSSNPYNLFKAQQYSNFNYGFTPEVGDTIKLNINATGPMTVGVTYIGLPVDNVNVVTTSTGSKTTFVYVVKN